MQPGLAWHGLAKSFGALHFKQKFNQMWVRGWGGGGGVIRCLIHGLIRGLSAVPVAPNPPWRRQSSKMLAPKPPWRRQSSRMLAPKPPGAENARKCTCTCRAVGVLRNFNELQVCVSTGVFRDIPLIQTGVIQNKPSDKAFYRGLV